MLVLQRKVQSKSIIDFQRRCPEYKWAKNLPTENLDHSYREVSSLINVSRQGGGAFIEDFGFESVPRTVAPQELNFTFTNYNDRFTIGMFAKVQNAKNRKALLSSQLGYQTMRMAEGLCNRFTRTFYGYSTGLVCKTSTNATSASQTLTLIDAYGLTETAADNAAYLGQMFANGDRIAIVRAGAIIANGIGTLSADPNESAGTIAVTMIGSADVDANDEIYFAQSSREDVASVNSCDLNKWPVGLLDAVTSTSLHDLSGSAFPNWTVALNDTSGGRFNGVRLMYGQDQIANKGGGEGPYDFIHTQGISRDIFAQQVAAVRFQDPMNMRLDGDVKVGEGVRPLKSRFVPPGRAFLLAKGAYRKWWLSDMPSEDGEEADLESRDIGTIDKIEDRAGFYVGINATWGNVLKRNNIAAWAQLTEAVA